MLWNYEALLSFPQTFPGEEILLLSLPGVLSFFFGTTSLTCEDVYATGLNCQEMFVLWFLVLRTKVVLYKMFLFKEEVVIVPKFVKPKMWKILLLGRGMFGHFVGFPMEEFQDIPHLGIFPFMMASLMANSYYCMEYSRS